MSVLKSRRTESKAEYIYTANKIYAETIRFLSRLSARYSRLMSDSVAKLASEVVDHCEKAKRGLCLLEDLFVIARRNTPSQSAGLCAHLATEIVLAAAGKSSKPLQKCYVPTK